MCGSRLHKRLASVSNLHESVLTYGTLSREVLLLRGLVDVSGFEPLSPACRTLPPELRAHEAQAQLWHMIVRSSVSLQL